MDIFSKYLKGDRAIWLITLFLGVASLLLVYSSIVTLAYKHSDGNTLRYLVRHGFFLLSGFGIIYITHNIKYNYFSRISQVLLFASIPLLALTLIVGTNINDASRWLTIPVINQSFQTSDFAKLALVMYVARMLSVKQDEIKDFKKAFLPIFIPVVIVCGLIFPANFSTAAVLFAACLVLMFIGRIPISQLISLASIGIVFIVISIGVAKFAPALFPRAETWVNRIENFSKGDQEGNYQVEQAKIAIATGGIQGKGPGNSTQRNFLPHPYSDFIYAIVIEEYGLIGGFLVMFLYLMLFFRAIRIVLKSPKTFGSLLVVGISFILVFQALINMAVAVNLLPVTGQPLPFMSMGGTSIWFTSVAIGVILSVSREVDQNQAHEIPEKENNELNNQEENELAVA
jgi:cell division protein FtsW